MFPHAHTINATSDPKPLGGSISAALAHDAYRPIARLMASLDLEGPLRRDGRLTVATVDKALGAANLPSVRRIELKATLARLGLI